ncbi:protein of unknown function [Candidatus Methylomirabilis oxygeniifera]|uniref:Uncharacterized protein n=1 Tax=Methylomirabilis oxygeniifera TaxID=671143 RepID=D5MKW0_METO1|nr:protein of unknown function [Candidatus Methylomirabilis oxyfera]
MLLHAPAREAAPSLGNGGRRVASLQWGHGSEAVETSITAPAVALFYDLQWGHGSEAVETHRRNLAMRRHERPSMGPRL